jgi:hypothetical protein
LDGRGRPSTLGNASRRPFIGLNRKRVEAVC